MLYLARKLLVFALLMGIPLSRAFSDALYFLAWLLPRCDINKVRPALFIFHMFGTPSSMRNCCVLQFLSRLVFLI